MFPDLSAVTPDIPSDERGTQEAIREILAFRFPGVAELLAQQVPSVSGPSDALQEAYSAKRGHTLIAVFMMAGATAGLYFAAPLWFLWLGLAGWGWARFMDRNVTERPFIERYESADAKVQTELDAFIRRSGLTEIFQVKAKLDAEIQAYKRIDDELTQELRAFKSNREARQRERFLDQFQVRRASISGIGPAKTATLISFGIETAADVSWAAVRRVPGFGDKMTQKLVVWRQRHEAKFRYDPAPNAQDVTDERAIRFKYAIQKANLEGLIRSGLTTLRTAKPRLDALHSKVRSDAGLLHALEDRARAEQDLRLLGASIPSSKVSISVPVAPRSVPQPVRPIASPTPSVQPAAKMVHPSCPKCGSTMHRRIGRYGAFWGCSRYPVCRGTRQI